MSNYVVVFHFATLNLIERETRADKWQNENGRLKSQNPRIFFIAALGIHEIVT